MKVGDIVQETVIKTIPKKKKCKKAEWLSEEALQIAEKRREVKGKGEKERYTYLNGEFQRIARRDKKAFRSDQCKEIEENNIMGKTRDLFKKIRDTKGTFHAKMGTLKDKMVCYADDCLFKELLGHPSLWTPLVSLISALNLCKPSNTLS